MQFAVGQRFVVVRVVAFPDDGHLVAAGLEMAVEAVGRGVEGAVFEPPDMQIRGVVGDILDLAVGLDPVETLALFPPKAFGVVDRLTVQLLVLGVVGPGPLLPGFGDRKELFAHFASPC